MVFNLVHAKTFFSRVSTLFEVLTFFQIKFEMSEIFVEKCLMNVQDTPTVDYSLSIIGATPKGRSTRFRI